MSASSVGYSPNTAKMREDFAKLQGQEATAEKMLSMQHGFQTETRAVYEKALLMAEQHSSKVSELCGSHIQQAFKSELLHAQVETLNHLDDPNEIQRDMFFGLGNQNMYQHSQGSSRQSFESSSGQRASSQSSQGRLQNSGHGILALPGPSGPAPVPQALSPGKHDIYRIFIFS
jgi:hypothetical protein